MSKSARNDTKPNRKSISMKTKQLVVVALMCALALLLSFIAFPIFPSASFLKLDISLVPSAVIGFAYGAGPGLLCGIACAVAHAVITGNWVGAIMSTIVAIAFILPSAVIFRRFNKMPGMILGLCAGAICLIIGVTIANLIIDPLFYGMPFDAVADLVVPAIIPFNAIKGILISVLTALVYRLILPMISIEDRKS